METTDTDIEFLISAFAYSFALADETFYLRKRDLKVIGVHMLDYALVSECKSEYTSGLTKEEERDIKEAIIASEKNYATHIVIPRLSKEERFDIMQRFIVSRSGFRTQLASNYTELVGSTEKYGIEFFKKGIKAGVEMSYLTNGIDDEKLNSDWIEFYRGETKIKALRWLEEQKAALQQRQ